MKAIIRETYGSPDILKEVERDAPAPRKGEVQVKIRATSVNASDYEFLTGRPLYARVSELFRPRYKILGSDIAGRVEAVGEGVSRFRPGDEVFGDIFETCGGFAEYVCARSTGSTIGSWISPRIVLSGIGVGFSNRAASIKWSAAP